MTWPFPARCSAFWLNPAMFHLLESLICLHSCLSLFHRFEHRSVISGSLLVSFLCRQNCVWLKHDQPHHREESHSVQFCYCSSLKHLHRRLFLFPSLEQRSEASSCCAAACSFDAFDLMDPCGHQKMKRCLKKKHITLSTTKKIYHSQIQNQS